MQSQLVLVLDPGGTAHFADAFTDLRKVYRWDDEDLKRARAGCRCLSLMPVTLIFL
jgi:hypothetical protein